MLTAPTNVRIGTGSPPSTGNPHAHFEALAARPDCLRSYSMRSQAQLNSLVKQPPSIFWAYDPANDTHPLKQDACKMWKPPRKDFRSWPALVNHPHPTINSIDDSGDESVFLPLRLPIQVSGGSLTLTWDFWWGHEFQSHRGTVNAWKAFFLMTHPTSPSGDGSKVFELLHEVLGSAILDPAKGDISIHHSDMGENNGRAPGVIDDDPFHPTGLGAAPLRTFRTLGDRWTRYLFELQMNVAGSAFVEWQALTGHDLTGGTYDRASLWIWDETRDPTRVIYRVPVVRDYPYLNTFRFAFDTSTHNLDGGGLTGPILAYARNVVALTNATVNEGDPLLFARPIAG